jgi:hypothetical protein
MDSQLEDIWRKSKLKGHSALPGCYEAPGNFSPQSFGYLSSDARISIGGTLEVDIKASGMVCSVVVGSFLSSYFFPPNISRSAPGGGALLTIVVFYMLKTQVW